MYLASPDSTKGWVLPAKIYPTRVHRPWSIRTDKIHLCWPFIIVVHPNLAPKWLETTSFEGLLHSCPAARARGWVTNLLQRWHKIRCSPKCGWSSFPTKFVDWKLPSTTTAATRNFDWRTWRTCHLRHCGDKMWAPGPSGKSEPNWGIPT